MDAQSFQHLLARLDLLTIKQKSTLQHVLQANVLQAGPRCQASCRLS